MASTDFSDIGPAVWESAGEAGRFYLRSLRTWEEEEAPSEEEEYGPTPSTHPHKCHLAADEKELSDSSIIVAVAQ